MSYIRIRFVVLVGKYGVGKTRVAKCLLEHFPHTFRLLTSNTTRNARSGDLPGEYRYTDRISAEQFAAEGGLSWPHLEASGQLYFSLRSDLVKAAEDTAHVYISILLPEAADKLSALYPGEVLVVWLEADSHIITQRLISRGGDPGDIARRQAEQSRWDKVHLQTSDNVYVISNDGDPEEAARQIQQLVWLRGD